MQPQKNREYEGLLVGLEVSEWMHLFNDDSEAIDWLTADQLPGRPLRQVWRVTSLKLGKQVTLVKPAPRLEPVIPDD